MVTGYVGQMLDENLDLNAFIWRIARGLVEPSQYSPVQDAKWTEARLRTAEKSLADWKSWPDHVRRSVVEAEVLNELIRLKEQKAQDAERQSRIESMKTQIATVKVGPAAKPVVDYAADQLWSSSCSTEVIDGLILELSDDGYVDKAVARREQDLVGQVKWYEEVLARQIDRDKGRAEIIAQLAEAVGPAPDRKVES